MHTETIFPPIMVDASTYKMEENIKRTKKIIEIYHPQGIAIKTELGHAGRAVLGDQTGDPCYMRPEDVTEFLNQARTGCLAIACSTAYGQYLEGATPEIHFDIVRAVEEVADVPVAPHDSSSSGNENIKKTVEVGISEVNICTKIFNYVRDEVRKTLEQTPEIDLLSLISRTEQTTKEVDKYLICLTESQRKTVNPQGRSAFQRGFTQTETDGGEQGEELARAAPEKK